MIENIAMPQLSFIITLFKKNLIAHINGLKFDKTIFKHSLHIFV